MCDDKPYAGVQTPDNQTPSRHRHPLANYQFSSDELRILRECNTESFFQRSLPLGTGFGLAAYYAVKYGKLAPNAKFGPIPKVVVSVIFGYFLGKVSYQRKCAEKIMQLPNSKLGEILRAKHKQTSAYLPDQGLGSAGYGLPFMQPKSDQIYDDFHLRGNQQSNSLDLDTERPSFGIDEQPQRQNIDVNSDPDLPLEPPKHKVSYEELRKQNRDQYLKSTSDIGISKSQLPLEIPPVIRGNKNNQLPTDDEQYSNTQNQKKEQRQNQYGDVWS